jgi:hypothetical protein
MWILGKLRKFRTLHIGPLDLHEAPPIWSGELRSHSHAVKHLVNRSATIVATRDLQVQLLIPCHVTAINFVNFLNVSRSLEDIWKEPSINVKRGWIPLDTYGF